MRITNNTMNRTFMRNLNRNLNNMDKYWNQLSSGKEVSKPSDNPLLVSKIMDLSNNILQNKQYNRNISESIGWTKTQDGALDGTNSTLNRIRDLIIYASSGTHSEDSLKSIGDEVQQKISELADTLNTNFDGRFIFAGQKTLTKPFEVKVTPAQVDDTTTPPTVIPEKHELIYNGNVVDATDGSDENLTREISKGVTINLITSGYDIVSGGSSVDSNQEGHLGKLLNDLLSVLKSGDTTKISQKSDEFIGNIDKHIDNILEMRSKIGAIHNRLESSEERNKAENLNLNTLLSEREDIDIAEKYMEYSMMKTVYQASLSIGAQLLQPSLLDYLR